MVEMQNGQLVIDVPDREAIKAWLTPLAALVATAFLGFLVFRAYDHGKEMATLQTEMTSFKTLVNQRMDSAEKRLDDRFATVDKRFDAVDQKLSGVTDLLKGIDARMVEREVDPTLLLARLGVNVDTSFEVLFAKGAYWALPKSAEARSALEAKGFRQESITELVRGYRVHLTVQ